MKKHSSKAMLLALALIVAMVLPTFPARADQTAVVCVASAPVYTTPHASTAQQMGTLKKGAQVTVRAVSGGVAKITISGKTGYMNAAMLDCGGSTPTATASPSSSSSSNNSSTSASTPAAPTASASGQNALVTADRLTVYRAASTSAGTLGAIRKNVSVTVLAVNGNWAAIRVAGKTGYVSASGLSIGSTGNSGSTATTPAPAQTAATPAASTPAPAVSSGNTATAKTKIKFYTKASTSSNTYGTFSAGATMDVRAVSGQWAKVVYKGKSGFVLLSGLEMSGSSAGASSTPAPSASAQPSAGSSTGYTHKAITTAYLYQKPSTSAKVLKKLSVGTQVTVKGESGGWLKVTTGGVTSYALEKDFIEISSKSTGLVVASTVTVYSSASLSAPAIGTLSEGATVDLYASSNGWAKVLFNGSKGYVLTSRLVVGASTYTTLKTGDSGTGVRTLQDRLEKLGYFDGVPGGNYGSITASAVKRFQNQMGLNVTGTANNATQAALFSDKAPYSGILTSSLSTGAKGELVTRLQTRLLYKSYYTGNVGGTYDTATSNAVKAFQKKAGLSQTGSADASTLKALFAPNAPAGSVSSGSSSVSLDPPDLNSGNEDIETVIRWAVAQLGKPYVYGSSGPNSFDCSGLTYFCFKKVGITLPRSAYDVGYSNSLGERIPYEELRRGDVVCFNTIADSDLSDHVGIYLGNGLFIHSPHTGSNVLIASMTSGYYLRNYSWARRPIK